MIGRWYLRRRAQTRAVAALHPDRAAQLCRQLSRAGVCDTRTLVLLARRGQASELPGNAEAMRKYETTLASGRRVKYGTIRADVRTVMVSDEMRAEIEEALEQGDNDGSTDS